MTKRKAVNPKLRRLVAARDGGKCLKCRRRSRLEVHHIVPVYQGGLDIEDNLITLCKPCHDQAPNDPVEFIHWAVSGLPPTMDSSKRLTSICVNILFAREGLSAKTEEALQLVDEIYTDLWKLQRDAGEGGDAGLSAFGDTLGRFLEKYGPGNAGEPIGV